MATSRSPRKRPSRLVPLSWILVFAAIASIVVAIVLTGPEPPAPQGGQTPARPREANFEDMRDRSDAAVLVQDAIFADGEIVVERAVLPSGGFVVIHEDDKGQPGAHIAVSGPHQGELDAIAIPMAGTGYRPGLHYAVLYEDNGDGVFTIEDGPRADGDGNIIMMSFVVKGK